MSTVAALPPCRPLVLTAWRPEWAPLGTAQGNRRGTSLEWEGQTACSHRSKGFREAGGRAKRRPSINPTSR